MGSICSHWDKRSLLSIGCWRTTHRYFPVFGQNAGYMNSQVSWNNHVGYTTPVIAGKTYTLEFTTLEDVRIDFSDVVVSDTFGLVDSVTLELSFAGQSSTCVASSTDCRAEGRGSCEEQLFDLKRLSGLELESRAQFATASATSAAPQVGGTQNCGRSGGNPWDSCATFNPLFAINEWNDNLRMWKPAPDDQSPAITLELERVTTVSRLVLIWERNARESPPSNPSMVRPRLTPGTCAASFLGNTQLVAADSSSTDVGPSAESCAALCRADKTCTHFSWKGPPLGESNTVTQSSTGHGGFARKAVDGNTNANYAGHSCTHTGNPLAVSVASATASQSRSGNVAAKAIDSDDGSRWESGKAKDGERNWIALQLTQPTVVASVDVKFETARAFKVNFYGVATGESEYTLIAAEVDVPGTAFKYTFSEDAIFEMTALKMESITEYVATT